MKVEDPKTAEAQDSVIHICPMHPEVRQGGPGMCPKCGMALEPVESSPASAGHALRKSILAGLGGAAGLFSFYFILLALLAGSWRHPLDELLALKYWIGTLILGFGIQIGMFFHIKNVMHLKGHGGKA
ncbi:MAG TPA: heavy metal-binding domain-containing protein, partial [Nitrospirota bacterium]|nr:heavy metal-binding domain-containing protein [Nitrospirota bacterium]